MPNPFQHMSQLDSRSESYWLEDVVTTGGNFQRLGIYSSDGGWLFVHNEETKSDLWLNVSHVISFKLMEG